MRAKHGGNGSARRPSQRQYDAVLGLAALRQRALERAAEVVRLAKEKGESAVVEGKTQAASQLSGVGGAIRRAAEKLQDQDSGVVADYVVTAAERVEQSAQYLEERDLDELIDDAAALARRQPVWFLGGMFLAGVAAAALMNVAAPATEGSAPNEQDAAEAGDQEENETA